jgi:putative ABC transport system permease protein
MVASTVRNPRTSLLNVGSITVSLLTVLAAAYRSLFLEPQSAHAGALGLVTHHRVSITQPMPVSFLPKISSIPGVRESMIWQWFGGTYKDAHDPRNFFARFAVELDRFFKIKPEVEMPDDQKMAFLHTPILVHCREDTS